jgi:hypothetical protein
MNSFFHLIGSEIAHSSKVGAGYKATVEDKRAE